MRRLLSALLILMALLLSGCSAAEVVLESLVTTTPHHTAKHTAKPKHTAKHTTKPTHAPKHTAKPTHAPKHTAKPKHTPAQATHVAGSAQIDEDGEYSDKDSVALYIHTYGKLPGNYLTKREAEERGWESHKGNLAKVLPGMSIGGDHFGNYDKKLPEKKGRIYRECDIDYVSGGRNAKRIIYASDGLVFYTDDHYEHFEQLY